MSETTQTYLGLESTRTPTNPGFQSVLNYIRERATSEYRKGELFERLMLTYLTEDPDYKEQFSEVYLYKQWAAQRTDFDANDIGIDLVAKERHGGYCAIQCKYYAEDTRISKPALDSFISASASELFTSRLIVDTGTQSLLWEEKPEHFLLGTRAMRFADRETKTTLIINEHVCLSGIPEEAHRYVVNGRTPLEWFIDRYKIKKDTNSGILNDPNGWFEHPRDLITAIARIVHVSVESTKIIEGLPSKLTDD